MQVDRALWVDMLRNLTINAQRACKGIAGAAITLRCQQQGSTAVFTVADTGCGIPAADLPRVTEAFLYGGQVPQPCRWWQRHRAGAVYPNRPGPRHPITNRQHRGCGYDCDRIRAYPWP